MMEQQHAHRAIPTSASPTSSPSRLAGKCAAACAAAVLASVGFASVQANGSYTDSVDAQLEFYADGIVDAHMQQHRIPGVTVGVVRNDRVSFVKGYGYANVEEGMAVSGQDTRFRIASISKTFIWTAVMMLVEEGKLDLDADVNTYLEGVELPRTFETPVTLNHLMAHRAGFEQSLALFMHSGTDEMSVADALERDMPAIVFEPGTRTSYSNYGSSIAAKVVADVSGMPYADFIGRELLAPLGMSNTTLRAPLEWPEDQRASLSVGYELANGWPQPVELVAIGPHAPVGRMTSTAADMSRWMRFHLAGGELDGVRLMSPETHAQLWSRAFDDRAAGSDLAHGFMTTNYYGFETFGHGGSLNGFYSNLVLVPELGIGVFVSQNAQVDRSLVSDLPLLLIRRLLPHDASLGETSTGADQEHLASECVGTYRNNRRMFTTFEKSAEIEFVARVWAAGDGHLVVSSQGESTIYAPLAGTTDTYQDTFGNRIVFGRDEGGAVTHYSGPHGIHSFERSTAIDSPELMGLASFLAVLFSVTTWLGLLWRRGVPSSQTTTGKLLVLASVLASIVVGVVVAAFVVASSEEYAAADYPSASLVFMQSAMTVLFVIGIAGVISLWPAWRSSGWGVVRKLHYSLYALSLGGLAFLYQHWNLVLAPFSG